MCVCVYVCVHLYSIAAEDIDQDKHLSPEDILAAGDQNPGPRVKMVALHSKQVSHHVDRVWGRVLI